MLLQQFNKSPILTLQKESFPPPRWRGFSLVRDCLQR